LHVVSVKGYIVLSWHRSGLT